MGNGVPYPEEPGEAGPAGLGDLQASRARFYDCLSARADALFELTDTLLCSAGPVTTLVDLSLCPRSGSHHPWSGPDRPCGCRRRTPGCPTPQPREVFGGGTINPGHRRPGREARQVRCRVVHIHGAGAPIIGGDRDITPVADRDRPAQTRRSSSTPCSPGHHLRCHQRGETVECPDPVLQGGAAEGYVRCGDRRGTGVPVWEIPDIHSARDVPSPVAGKVRFSVPVSTSV